VREMMTTDKAKGLSDEELEFYSRQLVLADVGYDGQLRLQEGRACIVGMGGLGSAAALQLAAMGVGHLRLVDYDVVEISNLQRQHLYDTTVLGYPKVEAAAIRLRQLNPHIEIEPLPSLLTANNAAEIIARMDVVVDGLDRVTPRYALNRACVRLGVPYVFGAAIMTYGNASTILPGQTACLECFQGGFADEQLPSCALVGVHPSILGIIASIEAAEATKILMGAAPRLAGKLLHCDVRDMTFEQLEVDKAEGCPVCGSGDRASLLALAEKPVAELCARGGRRTFVVTPKSDLTLNLDELRSILDTMGLPVGVKGELGITFRTGTGGTASILKSGVMIIDGAPDEERAHDFYERLVIDGLGISRTKID
jgi:molybdopterin/thiamine biosynthesis adenylyltransferase